MSSSRKRANRPKFESAFDKQVKLQKWLSEPMQGVRRIDVWMVAKQLEQWRHDNRLWARFQRTVASIVTLGRLGRPINRKPRFMIDLLTQAAVLDEQKEYEERYGPLSIHRGPEGEVVVLPDNVR